MKLQLEIYQYRNRNVQVVLRGQGKVTGALDDSDVFAKFVEVCQAFMGKHSGIPDVFLDALDDKGSHQRTSPSSC